MSLPRQSVLVTVVLLMLLVVVPLAGAAPEFADRGAWAPNVSYAANDTVTYGGQTYRCLQSHTSLTGWEPSNVPALWTLAGGSTTAPAGPSSTPTRTPTRTNTPSGPTGTPTRTATSGGAGCWAAWNASTAYNGGAQVSRSGQNYRAAYWTQGNDPATSSGPAGSGQPWNPMGACGGAGPTSTATRTVTPAGPTATPTRTATRTHTPSLPSATPTKSPTPGSGGPACAAPWNASTAYWNGNTVSEGAHNYRANWWNQNERPSTSTTGVWTDLGTCTPPTPGPTALPGTGLPERVSAMYADVSFTSITAAHQATGQKYYALAFILGHAGACVPAWDGTHLMSENYYAGEINAIRAAGGEVIVVFGGANGYEMASVCNTVGSLQAAYQSVIDQYDFKWIDLNIEGGMVTNTAAIDRLNKAIKLVQDANPDLRVSYTLPVLQSGLPQGELNVLSNAKANGVRVDYVNVMTMNYGPAGIDMGQAAIDAASNTHTQLTGLGLPARVGITPMIGQNNTQGEIFSLSDADQLLAFAEASEYVGWLSFWSLGRDNGGCPGQTAASASCSGLAQTAYEFTNKFKTFP